MNKPMRSPERDGATAVGFRDLPDVSPAMARAMQGIAARAYDRRPIAELTLAEARLRTRRGWAEYWSIGGPQVAHVEDAEIATSQGPVKVRFYDPQKIERRPVVFLHGGGFVVGDLDTHDCVARRLAAFSGGPVVSIAYRRAPEHPYPGPLDDCVAAAMAIAGGRSGLPLDGGGFALAGDSAGANLALGTALRLRDAGAAAPAALLLFYGCYDPAMRSPSFERFGDGHYMLSSEDIRWFWEQYLGAAIDDPPLYAAALDADLRELPPVFIGVGDCDPLFDDSVLLRERLAAAGATLEFRRWGGMIHGCIGMGRDLPEADEFIREAARWLAGKLIDEGDI